MRLKTIRTQLLFAADYHHQFAMKRLKEAHAIAPVNKGMAKQARRDFTIHDQMALALDAALKLL